MTGPYLLLGTSHCHWYWYRVFVSRLVLHTNRTSCKRHIELLRICHQPCSAERTFRGRVGIAWPPGGISGMTSTSSLEKETTLIKGTENKMWITSTRFVAKLLRLKLSTMRNAHTIYHFIRSLTTSHCGRLVSTHNAPDL